VTQEAATEMSQQDYDAADAFYFEGNFSKALELSERYLATRLTVYGSTHHLVAAGHERIARTLVEYCLYSKALAFYESALAIRLQSCDEDHLMWLVLMMAWQLCFLAKPSTPERWKIMLRHWQSA
jgi:tetratricopeptide (TPR) repeat protein